ncbi:MAG: aminotransferase class I/II-fold pyridoxal phosphate-dependent enzyme [Frankia sp.]
MQQTQGRGGKLMLNLTELEQRAIDSPINLSDGHPRQDLTDVQRKLVYRFPELFELARVEPFADLERSAQKVFFDALGQVAAPIESGRVFSVYSSSVATMVVANVLADAGHRVALIHPTFDNIHDILTRTVPIHPISEAACAEGDLRDAVGKGATCLFVTTPNNPTGWFVDRDAFERIAATCAANRVLLCLDTSFRGFDTRTQFDYYEILDRLGVEYLVIEDTGKLWPFSELKLGFLVASAGIRHAVEHALSDVLLTVSPFVLKVVEELSVDAGEAGLEALHNLIATNRGIVGTAVDELPGVRIADPDARVSVCRLVFPSEAHAESARGGLRDVGVHVLPCQQFHWAQPREGASLLRLALARDSSIVAEAVHRFAAVYRSAG